MITLTVFTPTYNRAYCLGRVYESLCAQTSKDFIWMIVDDGSTDNTKEIVTTWINENKVEIEYLYKKNGGMHTAHNTAYANIKTELNVCIDSDDWMPADAVEKIICFWRESGGNRFAGIIGLDETPDGKVIGSVLPDSIKFCSLSALYAKHGATGDKKLVYRSDLTKQHTYPEFTGERLVPLSYLYMIIGSEYPSLLKNDVYCTVDYQEGGSSKTIIKQYFESPKGFSAFRRTQMVYSLRLKDRIKACIHYVATSIIARDKQFINKSPRKFLTLLCIAPGALWYLYIKNTKRSGYMK